jgi:hypothetical protein
MRTVVDIVRALEGFPHNAPVQIGLVGPDGRRVVHHIHAVEVHEHGIVLRIDGDTPDGPSKARTSEADQTGEAIAVPPPPAVPGGLEGEGEEPQAPGLKA